MGMMDAIQKRNIDGLEVGVRSNGYDPQKKTIVLIHGIGVSSRYFLPLAEQLSNDYNVYALDLPGYGSTTKPPKPLSVKELAEITASFLVKNHLSNVTAIGHSMGCQIIAHLTTINPSLISKVVLLAPTTNRRERSVFKQGMRLFQDTFIESPKVNYVIFSDYLRMGVLRYLKTSKHMVNDHIEDSLRTATVPHLIIRGERDPIVPRDWASYLKTLSPKIHRDEIPGAPHAFQYKYARETSTLCRTFIER